MQRMLALIWLTLSLAFASEPAFAMSQADCPMTLSSSSSAMHHDSNDCCKSSCTAACATGCPAMIMAAIHRAAAPAEPIASQLLPFAVTPLQSVNPSGTDPPPRTIFS